MLLQWSICTLYLSILAFKKGTKKCVNFRQNIQNWSKGANIGQNFAFSLLEKSTPSWKKLTAVGCDKYQLWQNTAAVDKYDDGNLRRVVLTVVEEGRDERLLLLEKQQGWAGILALLINFPDIPGISQECIKGTRDSYSLKSKHSVRDWHTCTHKSDNAIIRSYFNSSKMQI